MWDLRKNLKYLLLALIGIGISIFSAYFLVFRTSYHSISEKSNEISENSHFENTGDANLNNVSEYSPIPDDPDISSGSETGTKDSSKRASLNASSYPIRTDITATVFWVGEPQGNGSSENNALSAWDDDWQEHFGCFDDPVKRNAYHPAGCTPKENPFYFDLPYDDFDKDGTGKRKSNAYDVVPWAKKKDWAEDESMLKNRWIKIIKGENACYGQWEDAGPYVYNDASYVFGQNDERPKNKKANNAGMDVSPALRDCLKFDGLNNSANKVSWQFVEFDEVPDGPWKEIVTISGTFWR